MDISIPRILNKLDVYLGKNQYQAADRHLRYWLMEADALGDSRSAFAILNEMVGLYRKCNMQDECMNVCKKLLGLICKMEIEDSVGAATAHTNVATAYKHFGMSEKALPLYKQAQAVYERELQDDDTRLAGLYNNMALALSDVSRYEDAAASYKNALRILERVKGSEPEQAITYLNLADLSMARADTSADDEVITPLLNRAKELLDIAWTGGDRGGNYAFVAEKCASVFQYYGFFMAAKELTERAEEIRNMTN